MMSALLTVNAQVGINTTTPHAMFHIKESSVFNPTGTDGILLPTIANFPSVNPVSTGNIVFLEKSAQSTTSLPDGFYYWNTIEWVPLATDAFNSNEYRNLYCAFGAGYYGSTVFDNTYRKVKLSNFIYDPNKERTGAVFSLENDEIIIGKDGFYLVSFETSLDRINHAFTQSNLYGEVTKNSGSFSPVVFAEGNTSYENTSATLVVLNAVVELKEGDKIGARITLTQLDSGVNALYPTYTSAGVTSLTLTYLHR